MIEQINQSQIDAASVAKLPTRPNNPKLYGGGGMSSSDLKEKFDELPLLAINCLNTLIELINSGKIGSEIPVLTVVDGEEKQTFTIADLAKKITDGGLSEILKITDNLTLLGFYEKFLKNGGIIESGDGPGSIVQIQGGVTNSDGSKVVDAAKAEGKSSVALGARTAAKGDASAAIGYAANAYQQGSVSLGGTAGNKNSPKKVGLAFSANSGQALGQYSAALNTGIANGDESFTFGKSTKANGQYSSAGGWWTVANTRNSFAIGYKTQAHCKEVDKAPVDGKDGPNTEGAENSFVMGMFSDTYAPNSFAGGTHSATGVHAENGFAFGEFAQVTSPNGFVHGRYNIVVNDDDKNSDWDKYAHIVGNGTSEENQSNAYTLDWEGNGWFAGNVTIGADKKELATQEFVSAEINKALGDFKTALDNAIALCDTYINGGAQ